MLLELDFSTLTPEDIANAPKVPEPEELVPILPVPEDAPAMAFKHSEIGAPAATWPYRDADGRLLGYMLRFDTLDGGKTFTPVTYCKSADGEAWRAKGFPAPYPLYNLIDLAARPDAPVLIVHGEKSAEAARKLFPGFVVTTSPFGYALAHNADWSMLEGRDIIISPDHCAESVKIVEAYAKAVAKVGPRSIRVLPPKLIATSTWNDGRRMRRPAVPVGWNMSKAEQEGWTPDQVAAELAKVRELQHLEVPMKLARPGLANFFMTDDGLEAEALVGSKVQREWISPEINVLAMVRDIDGTNWAKLVQFKTIDNEVKTLMLPVTLLANDGGLLREALLSAGLAVSSTRFGRERLTEYLSRIESPVRRLRADRIGWHDGVFITSERTYGKHKSGEAVEYAGADKSKVGQTAGTMEGWKTGVAGPAAGSSPLVFAIACAFAAPLIHLTNSESGGFHFVGSSSVGKTTALLMAGSVWGGGGIDGYLKTWRATANGIEGIAAAHCDVLLCLDEIGQVRGNEAGQCAYMLANGTGKIRGQRFGGARPPMTWRIMVLSSGELTLEAKVGEEKGNARVAAGQLVRFIDVEADAGKAMGLFEDLAGHESPEVLARALKKASAEHFGHAGPAFAEYLSAHVDVAATSASTLIEDFVIALAIPSDADGQVRRIARRFALVAAAGEIAIVAGVVPWAKGTAATACKVMYDKWLANRGGVKADEIRLALEQVRYFLQKNAHRMSSPEADDIAPKSAASAGFIKTMPDDTRCFCFPDETWSKDVCVGRDPRYVARILRDLGYLATDADRTTKSVRFAGASVRVHAVKESILTDNPESLKFDVRAEIQRKMQPLK
jgi:putative DNA primase/helicase